jgi:two-component system copper resistance phosphate regulon response regulator CusR
MDILVIEDDAPISTILRVGLTGAGYTVRIARDGRTGLAMALEGGHDLILLDLMLPGLDGWSIIRALRHEGCGTPVLMLTACDSPDDRTHGLELGAADYLTKPFHFPELLARIRNLVHRPAPPAEAPVVRIADLELHLASRRALRAGSEVPLTRREYSLLEILALHEGRPLEASFRLTTDPVIHELNRDYRAKDKPTDVLAFAQREGPSAKRTRRSSETS